MRIFGMLNEKGLNLNKIKAKFLKGEDLEVLELAISTYPDSIKKLIKDNSISLSKFAETIVANKEYRMSKEEEKEFEKTVLIEKYDKELSLRTSNFTISMKNNRVISVEKFFRIGKLYYKNFMGVDLADLNNKATIQSDKNRRCISKYKINTRDIDTFNKELQFYNAFIKNRSNVIFNDLKSKKIVPEYKNIKCNIDKPSYLELSIEGALITIKLNINLELRKDLSKNLSLMEKFLENTTNTINEHMNYNLYK